MRHIPQQTDGLFSGHRIDTSRPGAIDRITDGVRKRGLVTLTGIDSRTDALALAAQIMTVIPHRDSDSDGITTIRDTRRHTHRAGFAGFGNGPLEPHTERSGSPSPPRLMMLVCGQAAHAGGDSVLVDGRAVHADLVTGARAAASALAQPRSAYFGAGDGHPSQVFTIYDDDQVAVRLRLDGLARFSPIVQPYLPTLRAAIARHQLLMPMAPGQGYVLDNRRWLHARTAFTGSRVCWRALGEPRFAMSHGFIPQLAAQAAPALVGP
ncbi:TauD/TfdA family dioxygenase [Streptomyces kanamyceticus]|nr:TauD/TfdA family dioxygenase [Streptomyces kanamyceticus]